jgi:cytochrome P450
MRGYEQPIRLHAKRVEDTILDRSGMIVDVNSAIQRFAYGVMRQLAFSQDDESDTEWQNTVKTIKSGLSILGPLSPAPWIALFAFSFPGLIPLVRDWNSMMAYCRSQMDQRIHDAPPKRRDITSWLIADARSRGMVDAPEERRWLYGDAFSTILAGSDTTSSTMIFAFYHLARFPTYQERIRQELAEVLRDATEDGLDDMSYRDMEKLHFLNAFINETLRLHHPLPTSGSRIVSKPSGIVVGDQHIPFGTTLVAPRWSFGRHEAHYKRPHDFIPERWLDDSELVVSRKAFTPWANGRWSCLGKPVALFELRYFISLLVQRYTIAFPEGDIGKSVEQDYKDQVTAFPGQLNLIFRRC